MKEKYLNTIILIGPCGVGKTTIGQLLSQRIKIPFYNLDEYEPKYSLKIGFDPKKAEEIKKQEGFFAYYEYCRQFFDKAVAKFLEEFSCSILELGGGHPIVPDAKKQKEIKEILQPYKYIFLLLPDQSIEKSLEILRKRNKSMPEDDLNTLFFKDNSFFDIAKFIIYTEGKTPKQSINEISAILTKA